MPDEDELEDENDPILEDSLDWIQETQAWWYKQKHPDPREAYWFVIALTEGGYNINADGCIACWITNKCGLMIQEYNKNENIKHEATA